VFELIGNLSARNITYSFASPEVKQTSFRIDGILVPPIYATDLPIVFVEVQGYKDTKKVLDSSFFSQIFLYLHDYQPVNDWQAILIFTKRSLDPGLPRQYRVFTSSPQFQRIYLDELGESENLSLGLSVLQLIGLRPEVVLEKGKQLIKSRIDSRTNCRTTAIRYRCCEKSGTAVILSRERKSDRNRQKTLKMILRGSTYLIDS